MPTYRETILGHTPVAYYRLNEVSGPALDEMAGARHAAWTGTPTQGVFGALKWDPNNAVSIVTASGAAGSTFARASSIPSAAAFSAECWVNLFTSNSDANQAMMEQAVNSVTNTDWLLYYENDRFSWRIQNDANALVTITDTVLRPRDTWFHVVGTYGAGTLRLYVNGVQVATVTTTRNNAKAAGTLTLGRLADSTTYSLNGILDECAVYNRVLTAAEVAAHFDAGINQPFTGTVFAATYEIPVYRRRTSVALPSADVGMPSPTKVIAGRVYLASGALEPPPVEGATVLLVRSLDNVAVQQGFSGPGGYYSFTRDEDDPYDYYVVAFSFAGGTTQVHGTSNRGLVPQPSGEA